METVITVLENNAISVKGVVLQKEDFGYSAYYAMFVKKGVTFKTGSKIVQKQQGRPRTSTKVKKTLYIEKKHVEDLNTLVKGLNMSDRILAKINEGDTIFTIDDISIGLIKFWTNELSK